MGSPESPQLPKSAHLAADGAQYNHSETRAGTSNVARTLTASESHTHTTGRSSSDLSPPPPGENVRAVESEQRSRCVNAAAASSSHLSTTTVLLQLNDLVQNLASGIDAFQIERRALGEVLRMRKEVSIATELRFIRITNPH